MEVRDAHIEDLAVCKAVRLIFEKYRFPFWLYHGESLQHALSSTCGTTSKFILNEIENGNFQLIAGDKTNLFTALSPTEKLQYIEYKQKEFLYIATHDLRLKFQESPVSAMSEAEFQHELYPVLQLSKMESQLLFNQAKKICYAQLDPSIYESDFKEIATPIKFFKDKNEGHYNYFLNLASKVPNHLKPILRRIHHKFSELNYFKFVLYYPELIKLENSL